MAGEQVQCRDVETGAKATGHVKERTVFFDRPDLTRYFIQIPGELGQKPALIVLDRNHVWRKPRTFTKFNLQRFLRHTIHHERYEGAPWLVKEPYARQFNLETEIPHHLTHEAILAERRLQNGLKRNRIDELPDTFMVYNNHIMPRPGARPSQHDMQYVHERFDGVRYHGEQVLQMRPAPQQRPPIKQAPEPRPPPPPAPPPIKYPIEDLELQPQKAVAKRPDPEDFTKEALFPTSEGVDETAPIDMSSVGPLLEIWNTLTVFAEFFALDGFVFDDFVGAMYITSETVYCQLFYEAHCAVITRLVDTDGKVLSDTLSKTGQASKADNSSRESSSSPDEESSSKKGSRKGNGSDVTMQDSTTNGITPVHHRAGDMVTTSDWIQLSRGRRFQDGGWTLIIIGMLHRLSSHARLKTRCERILSYMAPVDKPATAPTAFQQYLSMNVNLRIQVLEMLLILVTETKPFKEHVETLVVQSTETRKEKTALQSQNKALKEELSRLDQQEKMLRPDTMNGEQQTKPDDENNAEADTPMAEIVDDQEDEEYSRASDDDDDDLPHSSRRVSSRAADLKKRKRELEDEKQTREETKELAEYRKILREFEEKNAQKEQLQEQIHEYEEELRENNCHRTKTLGQDRFLNRYIWFEHNGMSFEGDSQSTNYGYANGRVWVQGPDAIERPGILDLDDEEEKQYQSKFKMTVQARRDLEEGPVQFPSASHWGFYDKPEQIDKLISWLREKGEREKGLKKELVAYRKPIQMAMKNRKEHLEEVAEEYAKLEDRPVGIALRKKINTDSDRMRYPCLHWENNFALETYGQLLSDGPPPIKERGKKAKKVAIADREASAPPERERRVTRHGGYSRRGRR